MNLKSVTVSNQLKDYVEIKQLIYRAFPKNEQLPIWLLRVLALRKAIDFIAYYDNDSFCGVSYTINSKNLVFVLYLAVNDKIRSKGYGSTILQYLKQRFPNKPIALNIEPLEADSENYAQQIKRFEFYAKNGFVDTGYQITDNGENYQILATTDDLSIADYKSAIKYLSFDFYSPQVKRQAN